MAEAVKAGSTVTRWSAVQEAAKTLIRDVSKIDSDGIGLVLFGGSSIQSYDGVTSDKATKVFDDNEPRGGTPLAQALTACLALAGKSSKKDMIVVFTDGVPDDPEAAKKVILDAANLQETDDALTILFVQVGDNAQATEYLKGLDDDLKGAKFDIVDSKTVAEVDAFASTAELLYAAMND
jgi:Mg-chelatase subunit ChlD